MRNWMHQHIHNYFTFPPKATMVNSNFLFIKLYITKPMKAIG